MNATADLGTILGSLLAETTTGSNVTTTSASTWELPAGYDNASASASSVEWNADYGQTTPNSFIMWINETLHRMADEDRLGNRNLGSSASASILHNPVISLPVNSIIAVCTVLGVIGNCLLCFASFQPEIKPYSYSVFLLCASVSDTLALISEVAWHNMWMKDVKAMAVIDNRAVIHLCRFMVFILNFSKLLSQSVLILLSVDRYIGVARPLLRKAWCTVKRARKACAVAIVISAALTMPEVTALTEERFGVQIVCIFPTSFYDYTSYRFVWSTFLPCLVLFVLNLLTLCSIRTGMRAREDIGASRARNDEDMLLRASLALLTLPIFSFICLLPTHVPNIIITYIFATDSIYYSATASALLTAVLNVAPYLSAVATLPFASNFYLLAATSKVYRTIFCRVFRLKCVAPATLPAPAPAQPGAARNK